MRESIVTIDWLVSKPCAHYVRPPCLSPTSVRVTTVFQRRKLNKPRSQIRVNLAVIEVSILALSKDGCRLTLSSTHH
jgi:hypothetical protein